MQCLLCWFLSRINVDGSLFYVFWFHVVMFVRVLILIMFLLCLFNGFVDGLLDVFFMLL